MTCLSDVFYTVCSQEKCTVVAAKNHICLANLTQQYPTNNDNKHVVVDEPNIRSSGELTFIPMQLQNMVFCDTGVHLGKLAILVSL